MERISSQMLNENTKPTEKAPTGQISTHLAYLMAQAKAYFPSQVAGWIHSTATELGTEAVFKREWLALVERYGMDRFANALGNILRQSGSEDYKWFPLPAIIGAECAALKVLATEQQGSRLNLYRCPACPFTCASELRDAPRCRECGQLMAWAAKGVDVVRDDYREHAMAHPERFVRVNFAELEAQAIRNIAAKRRVA